MRMHHSLQFAGFLQGCTAGHEWGMLQDATSTLQVFAWQLHEINTSKVSCCLMLLLRPDQAALKATEY